MHRTILCVLQMPGYDLPDAFPESLRLFAPSSGLRVTAWAGTDLTLFNVFALVCYGNAALVCYFNAMSLL